MPESLHRTIKAKCAMRGTKIADEVRELLLKKYGSLTLVPMRRMVTPSSMRRITYRYYGQFSRYNNMKKSLQILLDPTKI